MGRTFIRQETQIYPSDTYDDTVVPSLANYETNPTHIEDNLNALRSQAQNFINRDGDSFPTGNWYDDLTKPTTLEDGTIRGIDATNAALHLVEKKRVLREVYDPGNDVTVPNGQNFVILAVGELPSNTTAAIGSVTTLGTVAAYDSVFTGNTLDEVSGTNALNPKNLCIVTDASSGDPILSGGRQVYALFQTESSTDGSTMTGTTPNRAKLSFVRPNATFDDLEACPVTDIEDAVINYATRERVRLEDLTEQDFLKGAVVDIPSGSTPTRQTVYDNQGTTPVDLTTNATLDLEGAGIEWQIRDDAEALLFRIIEGSAGGTSKVAVEDDVDEFDVDAVVSDFLNGIKVDTGAAGTTLNIGVTPNQIDSGGALKVASGGAGDLEIEAANEILFDDTNRTGSTWTATSVKLSDTTAEWDNYKTAFGEVSLMNAIYQAWQNSGRTKAYAAVTPTTIAPDTNVTGAGGTPNLDAQLPDYSGVDSFITDVDVYLNGELLRNGADASANHDVYPGDTPANGDLKFEFRLRGGVSPDQLCMIVYNS